MMTLPINHDSSLGRFSVTVEGHDCVCDYRLQNRVMHMVHTVVHPALEGRGIAAQMVAAAMAYAEQQGYKVKPVCSYVLTYFRRHPELQHLLAD